jgi:hypothetical protein
MNALQIALLIIAVLTFLGMLALWLTWHLEEKRQRIRQKWKRTLHNETCQHEADKWQAELLERPCSIN